MRDVPRGARAGSRRSSETITTYKSLGQLVQDLAATRYLHGNSQGAD